MLNSVNIPPASDCLVAYLQTYENHFIEKTEDARSSVQLPDYDPSAPSTCSAVFNQFEPVSLATLVEIVEHLKSTVCPQDIIPTRIFKQTFSVIGPSVMSIMNCFVLGSVPVYFKHAIVQPLIKKSNLDPIVSNLIWILLIWILKILDRFRNFPFFQKF